MKQWKNLEELKQWVSECDTIAELCRKLELQPKGGNYNTVKAIIEENGLDISHFKGKHSVVRKKGISRINLSDVLEGNVVYGNSNALKERLIKTEVKERKCECCGNTMWLGLPIPLELHHKNGDHYDNHLQNLELLCPNCHALTDSYRGRKIDKELEDITEDVQESINKLKEKERIRAEEVYKNHLKNGDIAKPKATMKIKKPKYCEYCGKEIIGRGSKYCSHECASNAAKQNIVYDADTLLEQSKTVQSLIALAKLYNITDNALKKHLVRLNIYDEIRANFKSKTKTVLQFDSDNNFIKEWVSAKEAAEELNLQKSKILATCRGEQKSSGGFVWKYKE